MTTYPWYHFPDQGTFNRCHGGRVVRASEADEALLGIQVMEEMYQDACRRVNGLSIKNVDDYSAVLLVDVGPWALLVGAARFGSPYVS